MFNVGRHKYTFETVCVEDNSIKLIDDTNKIILNTKGVINDLNDELIDFLNYVEHSDESIAANSNGTLVKNIHKRVLNVKNDASVEVEFMTLLERDREKVEEGKIEEKREIAKNLLDILDDETIALKTGLDAKEVKKLREENEK